MMKKPYIRVFDPLFTADYAHNTGRWSGLRSYLQVTKELSDITDPRKPCALQTAFYRYADNIAVLVDLDGVFYCQTIVGGVGDKLYEVLKQTDELRAFFESCGDNLTVMDNDRAHTLIPEFDNVLAYVQCFEKARLIGEEHREEIHNYAAQLRELQEQCQEMRTGMLKNAYTDGIYVAEQYLITLNAMAKEMAEQAMAPARRCILKDDAAVCRMFGLFVHALLHGIHNGRHLQRYKRILSVAFDDMLSDLRLFMEMHPNIEEEYAQYLHLPANERAKLHVLLEDEGLFGKKCGYISGDIL